MANKLRLQSKNDIPFKEIQLTVHNPTLDELSLIGEDVLFSGCDYLTFSKDNLEQQDKIHLKDFSNFEVLMTMISDKQNPVIQQIKLNMTFVLTLLFPDFRVDFLPRSIMLVRKDENDRIEQHFIDENNFESLKNIVSQIFCLEHVKGKSFKYNPGGPQARALAKKFKQRQEKLAKIKSQGKQQESGINILYYYVSILSVGLQKDKNALMQYTVSQLIDEFYRFKMKLNFDMYTAARMAGAQNLDEVENWMGEIQFD